MYCNVYSRRAAKRVPGNVDSADSPCFAAVSCLHVAGDTVTLGHGVDVVGIGNIQNNLGVDPRCEKN
jgi:hypothetical protein